MPDALRPLSAREIAELMLAHGAGSVPVTVLLDALRRGVALSDAAARRHDLRADLEVLACECALFARAHVERKPKRPRHNPHAAKSTRRGTDDDLRNPTHTRAKIKPTCLVSNNKTKKKKKNLSSHLGETDTRRRADTVFWTFPLPPRTLLRVSEKGEERRRTHS